MLRIFLILLFFASVADAGMIMRGSGGGEPPTYPPPAGDWKLENGALATDSSGNSNTLTVEGVTNITTIRIEGTGAGLFDSTDDQLFRSDADLSAGFWGKSSGGSLTGTACSAFYPGSIADDGAIITKYGTVDPIRSWRMLVDSATTSVEFQVGTNSGGTAQGNIISNADPHLTDIAINHWYAACVSLATDGKTYRIRLYDCGTDDQPTGCSHTGTDITGAVPAAMSLTESELNISNNSDDYVDFLGVIDRTTVWNEELTTGEMDAWAAELGI